jgi:putative transposase
MIGPIQGERVSEETKQAIMDTVIDCKSKGATLNRTCELLQIEERRVRNWLSRLTLVDAKPGPMHAPHALLPEERQAIIAIALDERYIDDSHRVLTAKGVDCGSIAASASTVYRVMRQQELTTDRSGRSHRNGNSRKPDRPELTGPGQRWCWDISYLRTLVPGKFLYLYVLLDEYSRKVVAFRISWSMTHAEGKELVDEGIEREGLTPEQVALLTLFNDRGTQMKAKSFKRFLEELGISQKFARPRTPNDNPFVESLFSTTKGALEYPGEFTDDIEAIAYFAAYFNFYNNERLHGKIGYVTPAQRHRGEDKAILELRNKRLAEARRNRLLVNRSESNPLFVAVENQIDIKDNCLTESAA